jgi:hypothetical protein
LLDRISKSQCNRLIVVAALPDERHSTRLAPSDFARTFLQCSVQLFVFTFCEMQRYVGWSKRRLTYPQRLSTMHCASGLASGAAAGPDDVIRNYLATGVPASGDADLKGGLFLGASCCLRRNNRVGEKKTSSSEPVIDAVSQVLRSTQMHIVY